MTSPRVIYLGIRTEKSAVEVGGWSNVDQMGLRDALIYDAPTRKFRHFTKSEVADLITILQTADLVVGFNQLNFDYKVLSTYSDKDLVALPNFDMLAYIEQTLDFRVSRANLVQNTLGVSKNDKNYSNFVNKVDITKKLFAHACKEGYLSYENKRFGGTDHFDTSNWAKTARNLCQRNKLLAETKVISEKNTSENSDNSIPNAQTSPITPWKDKIEANMDFPITRGREYPSIKPNNSTTDQVDTGNISDINEHQLVSEHPVFEPTFNAIGRVSSRPSPKNNIKKNGSRYYYIDGSGTLASEWVEDNWDIVNIKEELARGI